MSGSITLTKSIDGIHWAGGGTVCMTHGISLTWNCQTQILRIEWNDLCSTAVDLNPDAGSSCDPLEQTYSDVTGTAECGCSGLAGGQFTITITE
jgi:hypothetical protein